jgi:hypothetical protein
MKGEMNGKREKNKKKTLLAKILSEINKCRFCSELSSGMYCRVK